MGPFKIISKVMEVLYRLDLLLKIKIYLVYYITILKLLYKNYKLLMLVTQGNSPITTTWVGYSDS